MPVNGQDVKFNYYTRAKFNSLSSKDNNAIYYVEETDNTISMYLGNREIDAGSIYININYADLVALRNSNSLEKGAFYRIIDYETTAVQTDTVSAGHLFDIIVQALDEKTLSENAFAINSARDTAGYFDGMQLEAWKLKYKLTNESKYYETMYQYEGKYVGIINTGGQTFYAYECYDDYYLLFNEDFSTNPDDVMMYEVSSASIEDSFNDYEGGGNFFVRKPSQLIEDYKGYIYELIDEKNNKLSYDFKNIKFKREVGYFYTFDDNGSDASLLSTVNNNEIRIYEFQNNVVFFGDSFYNNTIGHSFFNNTIENYFADNTIGNDFTNNTIGEFFNRNNIWHSFRDNTIGNSFSTNTIGNNFSFNTIENNFRNNTIDPAFGTNTIGDFFESNTIGYNFYNNTIGTGMSYNSIGNSFANNTISNYLKYNTIGSYFRNNTIASYFQYNTVGNNVQYIRLSSDGTYSNQIKYLYLKSGLSGTSSANRLNLNYFGLYGREYPTTFEIIDNGNIISSWEATPLTRAGTVKATKTTATWSDTLEDTTGGTLENYREKLTTVSASDGSINLSLGNVFQHTPSGNRTYSITNAVSGVAHSFTLIVNMGATVRTLTFPASVKWQGGEIPDMTTANKTYVLTFLTVNGGTTWLGMFGGEF